jgi:hypothetical protein
MAKRRKAKKKSLREAKKLLDNAGYPNQFINAEGHLIAKNPHFKMSITVSLKDASNLVEHVRQQINRNFKKYAIEVGLIEAQEYLRKKYPTYTDLKLELNSTDFKEKIDKDGSVTGVKGKRYYGDIKIKAYNAPDNLFETTEDIVLSEITLNKLKEYE